MSYEDIKVGQYLDTKIVKVMDDKIKVRLNRKIVGNLSIEQIQDQPTKQIPMKYQEVGKEIKVRVLSIDLERNWMEVTRKAALMQEKCPVYTSHKEVTIGDEFVGTVVAENQFGYIVKGFGQLKGLLTFDDLSKAKKNIGPLMVGSLVKAFVLFKKAGKGFALTMSKKNIKQALVALEKKEKKQQKEKTELLPGNKILGKIKAVRKHALFVELTGLAQGC